tara:strand:+ start:30781 stop:31206 length:426 start_codon:yes stop_codon:yes gene_type:complete
MRIAVAKAAPEFNTQPLPPTVLEKLTRKYSYMPDIEVRLRALPVIKRGRNLALYNENTPHQNAVDYSQAQGVDLYVGYLILPDGDFGFDLVTHSFCVSNNEVIEPTQSIEWKPSVRYVGRKVDQKDIKNLKYLNDFNRLFL